MLLKPPLGGLGVEHSRIKKMLLKPPLGGLGVEHLGGYGFSRVWGWNTWTDMFYLLQLRGLGVDFKGIFEDVPCLQTFKLSLRLK
jgi:hypothetical protein